MATNPFYQTSGAPANATRGQTQPVRDQFQAVQDGFDDVFDALDPTNVHGTSTTSLTIGTGSKNLTIETQRAVFAGQTVVIAYTTAPGNRMVGTVTSYDAATGALVVDVTEIYGSGTQAAWTVSYGVLPSDATLLNTTTGASIASAATVNLNNATGNRVHITGTTTITAITLTRGPRTLIFDGALTLTHHATNNNLPGGANITTAAGDRALYESDGTTVYCVAYVRASGIPIAVAADHEVTVITGNGMGSTNTRIRRFSTVQRNVGTAITYADSATAGASFTANEAGLYEIFYAEEHTAGTPYGATVNSAELTTAITSTVVSTRVGIAITNGAGNACTPLTRTMRLAAGDVVRPHAGASLTGTTAGLAYFSIRKVGI
jgi:hypothetical protein